MGPTPRTGPTTARAEAGFLAAESLFAGTGQRLEIAYARQNRALVAFAAGDLPGALRHLDDAAGRYAELGVAVPDAALDRCAVLLAAGLPADALAGVEAALAGRITATKRAELRLAAARIALAVGRPGQAAERAILARSMFGTRQREWWRIHATLVLLQARFLAGRPPGRLLAEARRTAARLDELRSDEAPDAWLLAGRIALAAGPAVPAAEASRLLGCAARAARRRVPAYARAAGSLAIALQAEQAGDRRRRLERAEPGGFPATVLHRERLRLEAAVRRRTLWVAGRRRPPAAFDASTLLTSLASARLLELVVVDGDLHVLVCGDGRIRRLSAGAAAEAAREVACAARRSGSSCPAASPGCSPRPAPTSCSAWPARCCRSAPRASWPAWPR